MATESNKSKRFLDFSGLSLYDNKLRAWLSANKKSGVIGLADEAGKLAVGRKIELTGGVSGEVVFDGSQPVTLNTQINFPANITADLTGNASTADSFSSPKTISLTGDLTGSAQGGTTEGWSVSATIVNDSVTAAKLAGDIPNNKLSHSTVTIGSTNVALGGSALVIAGLTSVTSDVFAGTLAGTASKAEKDALGNDIPTTYATKAWTRDQITASSSTLYTFKGSIQNYGDLSSISNPAVGDTYNIIQGNNQSTGNPNWPEFSAGTNFAWNGTDWENLGTSLNLSNYYAKNEVDALLNALKGWVNTQITTSAGDQAAAGTADDIRVFTDSSSFPLTGIPDVVYVDSSTGVSYIWVEDGLGGGEYQELSRVATTAEVSSLFE